MNTNWNERWWGENEADISYAREKFDNILQVLKENPEKAKDSTRFQEESSGRNKDPFDKDNTYRSMYKSNRNRKRRGVSDDDENVRDSVVIKVFERSVDFGHFSDNAPLFPMCRAWLRNMNQGDPTSWGDVPSNPLDEEMGGNVAGGGSGGVGGGGMGAACAGGSGGAGGGAGAGGGGGNSAGGATQAQEQLPDCVYSLPKPQDNMSDNEVKIPAKLPAPVDSEYNINVENPPKELTPELLLEQHIGRWREIRSKWRSACRENQTRYTDAVVMLRDMYDKFSKELS